jgi:uncharacterized membrane-anchored protein
MADRAREIWFREQPGSLAYYKPIHWKAFALFASAAMLFIASAVVMDKFGLLQTNFALALIPLVVVFFGTIIIAGLHTGKLDDSSGR